MGFRDFVDLRMTSSSRRDNQALQRLLLKTFAVHLQLGETRLSLDALIDASGVSHARQAKAALEELERIGLLERDDEDRFALTTRGRKRAAEAD